MNKCHFVNIHKVDRSAQYDLRVVVTMLCCFGKKSRAAAAKVRFNSAFTFSHILIAACSII